MLEVIEECVNESFVKKIDVSSLSREQLMVLLSRYPCASTTELIFSQSKSIKELKEILMSHFVSYRGCVEKGDLVDRILETCK